MSYYHDERPSSSDGRTFRPRNYHDHGRRSRDPSPVSFRQPSSRLQPDGRFYSNRFSFPISQPLTKITNSAPKRQSWPPSPLVEDESEALAKEANAPKARAEKDDAQSRGTVDQLPIILDVPEEAAKAFEGIGRESSLADSHPDGPSTGSSSSSTQASTPPKSDQSTDSRGRLRTPPVSEYVDPSLLPKRQSSPYVFTPKAPPSTSGKLQDSGYFSSRDMKTPVDFSSPSEKRGASNAYSGKSMSDALRGKGIPYAGRDKVTGKSLSLPTEHSDEAIDSATDDESYRPIPDRAPARYSPIRNDVQGDELRNSLREMMAKNDPLPRVAALKAETLSQPRRSSDGAGTLPRPFLQDQNRRPPHLGPLPARNSSGIPSPLITPLNTAAGAAGAALASAYERRDRSCPSSPTGYHARPLSPPRSPKGSAFSSKQVSPNNGSSSRPGSRPSSRPSSPSSSEHSRYEDQPRRTPTFPSVLDDRTQRTSRLAASTFPPGSDSMAPRINIMSPSPVRAPNASSSFRGPTTNQLPYPTDDIKNFMPSEELHRYDPSRPIAVTRPPKSEQDGFRSPQGSPPLAPSVEPQLPSRPNLVNRHTYTEGLPTAGSSLQLSKSSNDSASNIQSLLPSLDSMKQCPRMQYSRDFDDWYNLDGFQGFNICPACVQAHFADSRFRDYVWRLPRVDRNALVKCDFGSQWMRVAWILTKQQNRTDLRLLSTVTNVQNTEKLCPGANREPRTWYTILNLRGETVSNFDVCSGDVKMIEELLPSLRGIFVRGYSHSRRRACDLRVDSKRFSTYLDVLININDKALLTRRPADLQPFIDLAGKRAQTPECSRDDLISDRCWHIMPQLPEFTVCEECYTEVVWPAIANGSPIASHFNRTPLLVAERDYGTSCQLYSDRMRHVFRKAIRHSDMIYLSQRVKERKGIEMELQTEAARVRQSRANTEDILSELARIQAEWKKWE